MEKRKEMLAGMLADSCEEEPAITPRADTLINDILHMDEDERGPLLEALHVRLRRLQKQP